MVDRPWRFRFLLAVFLFFLAAGGQRMVSALINFSFLKQISDFLPWYLAVTGMLWFFLAGTVLLWFWFNWKNKQRPVAFFVMVSILLMYWMERLFLYPEASAIANQPFMIILSVVGFITISLALFLPQ